MLRIILKSLRFMMMLAFAASCAWGEEEMKTIPHEENLLCRETVLGDVKQSADNPILYANYEWPDVEMIKRKQISNASLHQAEIDRTWYWLEKIIKPCYLPSQAKQKIILMPEMKRGDDWVMIRYEYNGLKLQVIDGRSLTIVIKAEMSEKETSLASMEKGVTSIFKKALFYDYLCNEPPDVKTAETRRDGADAYYGTICWERGKFTGWLQNGSVKWWSNGKCVLFNIQKVIVPPPSKIHLNAELYVGGIPCSDPRSFKRFDPQQRIDFTKEFRAQVSATTKNEVNLKAIKGGVKKTNQGVANIK